jgi:hypothetical protein
MDSLNNSYFDMHLEIAYEEQHSSFDEPNRTQLGNLVNYLLDEIAEFKHYLRKFRIDQTDYDNECDVIWNIKYDISLISEMEDKIRIDVENEHMTDCVLAIHLRSYVATIIDAEMKMRFAPKLAFFSASGKQDKRNIEFIERSYNMALAWGARKNSEVCHGQPE